MKRRTLSYEGAGEDEVDVTGTIFPLLWPRRSDVAHKRGINCSQGDLTKRWDTMSNRMGGSLMYSGYGG